MRTSRSLKRKGSLDIFVCQIKVTSSFQCFPYLGINRPASACIKAIVVYDTFEGYVVNPCNGMRNHGIPTYRQSLFESGMNDDIMGKSVKEFYTEYVGFSKGSEGRLALLDRARRMTG